MPNGSLPCRRTPASGQLDAHDGQLAGDILRWLRQHRPEIWSALEYWILEPSAATRQRQEKALTHLAAKIRWFDSWAAVPPTAVHGVIFSNELLDAMRAHRLGWDATSRQWFEWGVELRAGEFAWIPMPLKPDADPLAALPLPAELLDVLPDGFTAPRCAPPPPVGGVRRRRHCVMAN